LEFVRTSNASDGSIPDLTTLQEAVARGAKVELSFLSPPVAIKASGTFNNGTPLGPVGGSGDQSCLSGSPSLASNYTTWANYIVSYINTMQGGPNNIPITYVSIQNEPNIAENTYGSCDMNAQAFDVFIKTYLGPALTTAGLTTQQIIMPEVSNWISTSNPDLSTTCLNDASCAQYVDIVAYHGYGVNQTGSGISGYSLGTASGRHLWQGETDGGLNAGGAGETFDPSMADALGITALSIHNYLTLANVSAWEYWELAYTNNYGLADTGINPAKRMYVEGNWSKFVRSGWVRIDATANPQTGVYITAFKDALGQNFAIVAVNTNASLVNQTINLSGFPNITNNQVTDWETSSSNNLVNLGTSGIASNQLNVSLLSSSVTTFVGAIQSSTPLWNGIIAPNRGMNWAQAGLPAGLPDAVNSWPTCTTIAPYSGTAATINTALTNCESAHPSGGVVVLQSGTFNLSGGINMPAGGHIALRGAGASSTDLVFSSNSGAGCNAFICQQGNGNVYRGQPNSQETVHNVTAGLSQGSTTLTLDSVSGITANVSVLLLNQCDTGITGAGCIPGTPTDNSGYFDCAMAWTSAGVGCSVSTEGPNGPSWRQTGTAGQAWQMEEFLVTGIAGNVVTISRPLHYPNWSTGQSPQVIVINMTQQVGVENLKIDASADSGSVGAPGPSGVSLYLCYQCWVRGIATVNAGTYGIKVNLNVNSVVQHNYTYGNPVSYGDNHGVRIDDGSMNVVQNNICQKVSSCLFSDGPEDALVAAYNFSAGLTSGSASTGNSLNSFYQAHAFDGWHLFEGNFGSRYLEDLDHGGHVSDTLFRNMFTGYDNWSNGGHGSATQPGLLIDAVQTGFDSRYDHILAGVYGTPGVSTTGYLAANGTTLFANGYIFILGAASTTSGPGGDTLSRPGSTTMAYCNWDVFNGATRFNSGEVPTSAPASPTGVNLTNPVPTACTASVNPPPSFYYPAKPNWWTTSVPYPPIGYDVTGGNLGQCPGTLYTASQAGLAAPNSYSCPGGAQTNAWAGHANANPAMTCYFVLGGLPDGSGSVLNFNADACYPSTPTPAYAWTPPSNAFGNVNVGTLVTQTFQLQNVGTATGNLNITIQTPGSIFSLQPGGTCGATLAVLATCNVVVGFQPPGTSTYTNYLLETDTPYGVVQTAALTGTGIVGGFGFTPTSVNFGNIPVGTPASPQTVTLTNNTGSTVTISSMSIIGVADYGFSTSPTSNCGGSLVNGASCTVTFTFTPALAGSRTATFSTSDSATGSPHTVALSGNGTSVGAPSGLTISIGMSIGKGVIIQ
jgi:O-glycosyl hydrolase